MKYNWKLEINIDQESIPQYVRQHIMKWKKDKEYPDDPSLTFGQIFELHAAVTNNLHKEDSDGRFFNHIMTGREFTIAWDGEQAIDIMFYETVEAIKFLHARSGTFTEEIIP